ncbi:GntR family transcriptional regulator [Muricoccus aerilatus]|uniref:GntR family transcriptional regulator n=1 Tax=Muricoccus aerilatus TaxID=452982 RepID=UPI000693691A|nr:GntR family transcriptional regulator [Roseomonas aerilata]
MPNAAERAYQVIRDRILRGGFAPGAPLREEMLASEIGVSRTPVRDALRRLLADGLVESTRNQGSFVANLRPEELADEFELRALLEGHAARKAATRITPEELAEMEALAERMERVDPAAEAGISAFSDLNGEFHAVLARASRSRRLEGMLRRLVAMPLVLLKEYRLQQRVGIERSNRQHREILAALSAGNPEWAALATSAHIISTTPRDLLRDGAA